MSEAVRDVLLDVEDLAKHFSGQRWLFSASAPEIKAVDGVSFAIARGSTLGLVGESGCGKSTTGRLLLRLLEPTRGHVRFGGRDVLAASATEMRRLRREMQIVFQDPYSTLNPRMTIGQIVEDPLIIHGLRNAAARRDKVIATLHAVGLSEELAERYPHSFSGGQRQRVAIARALVLDPSFIVCDEPVSALDVSIQAQIINLLGSLQRERSLSYLFISHDLSVVKHMADYVAVMHLGRIVELADRDSLYAGPLHPYTRALLSAVPVPDPESQPARPSIEGAAVDAGAAPSGCRFRSQCPHAQPICARDDPALVEVRPGHKAACHFAGALPEWPPAASPRWAITPAFSLPSGTSEMVLPRPSDTAEGWTTSDKLPTGPRQ